MALKIESFGDMETIFEDYDTKNGERVVKRTGFAALGVDDQAYFGLREGVSKMDLSLDDMLQALKPIPFEEVYPEFTPGLTKASDEVTNSQYIKRPDWAAYRDMAGTDFLPRSLIEEAKIFEILSKHPHPNIVGYHGCRVRRGRITGIVLDKYQHDLGFARVLSDQYKGKIDQARIMPGVRAAVEHLHSIGLAHNDLNPANVMISEDGEPILIDFGSCARDGEHLSSTGTPGWYKEAFHTSDREHDLYGLEMLETWLNEWIPNEPEIPTSTKLTYRAL